MTGLNAKRGLQEVVKNLCTGDNLLTRKTNYRADCSQPLPSNEILEEIVRELRSILFPGYFGISEINEESVAFHVGAALDRVVRLLEDQIRRGLCFACRKALSAENCQRRAYDLTNEFLSKLPYIQNLLASDVLATYQGDPAATAPEEAIFCYPGMLAITNHRLAHELYKLDIPLLPRMISEQAHSTTGIDIHPGAQIGKEFFIDHGTGIVIGETCIIGERVRIYQGVTLGAKSFPLDENGKPIKGIVRHPIVEDEVIIYGGATILGRITLGKGTVIGGNVWLTESVPPGSKITQAKNHQDTFEYGAGI